MHEDAVLFNMFFRNTYNGVYVEMGALDGVEYSNTLFFQQTLNWTGVLIEPGRKFAALQRNRGSSAEGGGGGNVLHNLAVCAQPGRVEFKYVRGSEAEGGLETPLRDWGKSLSTISVKCERLGTILKASGVSSIDLFSLDVEGRELEVLQSMDWSISFKVLVVESNRDRSDIAALLISKGYEYIREQRGNAVWALSTFKPSAPHL